MYIPRAPSKRFFLIALLLWCFGIIYGSLIPFDFHAHPVTEAWRGFLHAPWLEVGMWGRADWVANLLLFIPLAYLIALVFIPGYGSAIVRGINAVGVMVICVLFAVGIEFAQIFFPPRTVSLNDIAAEAVGSALGIGIWWVAADRLGNLYEAIWGSGLSALKAVLACYALAYLALSLFPYDFLVSRPELSAKFASGSHGWLLAPNGCKSHFRCLVKNLAEILAVAPFGVWLRLNWAGRYSREMVLVFVAGALLGAAIEAAQFFTVSGISQGFSIVTRACGFCLGYYFCYLLQVEGVEKFRPWFRPMVAVLALPYLITLVLVNGIHPDRWVSASEVLARMGKVHLLPFYYYYYTTETRAMVSLLGIAGLYGPIGVGAGIWAVGRKDAHLPSSWLVALAGGALCTVVEFGKLFDPARHADFTDVLIAAAAAAAGLVIFRMFIRRLDPRTIVSKRIDPTG